jgi:hypothetical protein
MTGSLAGGHPDRRGLLRRLAAGPGRIATAASTSGAVVPETGGWTAHQVVLHLVAVEVEVFQRRLRDLATIERPRWTWTEPGPAPAPADETIGDAAARFAAARAATLAAVRPLDDAGWQRFGDHATLGRLDVAGVLQVAVEHDAEHLLGLRAMGRTRPG